MHSVLQFLHKMPVTNPSKLCLRNVFELMELETISNIGYYASFYVDTTEDQVIKQMKLYITNKIYNTRYGDLVPPCYIKRLKYWYCNTREDEQRRA